MERFSFQALVGAAFLMATSAIGPGFLTQTSLFTSQFLGAMLGIVLIVIALDIIAQLNIWWQIRFYLGLAMLYPL